MTDPLEQRAICRVWPMPAGNAISRNGASPAAVTS